MTPLSIILALVGLALGFFVGRRYGARGATPSFTDPDFAKEMSEKGRQAIQARIARRKNRILERARKHGKITNDDVEDLFCISDATARNYLNELEGEGKLTQIGDTGRGVHYTPS